ncbi:hypothetical protein [Streptomyces longispororuber]|uniref:hypothetical protein n=1 Tax=Streptomyces longispororuber TaxID=68230 RepID=UPI00210B0634|nr:hypothetical protein [Streptomyces longispororuber]MCQ4206540.1 hypothetical protein [Streptomyces longispororuber]
MTSGAVFGVVWGLLALPIGASVALNFRGAAEVFHELVPEYRLWPRSVGGARIMGGVFVVAGAVALVNPFL